MWDLEGKLRKQHVAEAKHVAEHVPDKVGLLSGSLEGKSFTDCSIHCLQLSSHNSELDGFSCWDFYINFEVFV